MDLATGERLQFRTATEALVLELYDVPVVRAVVLPAEEAGRLVTSVLFLPERIKTRFAEKTFPHYRFWVLHLQIRIISEQNCTNFILKNLIIIYYYNLLLLYIIYPAKNIISNIIPTIIIIINKILIL
ncbi:MAG: hypothetical protein GY738_09640 [Pseudoalteromonas sp.]|nr:hypothetical protein [Pseudoalteromonas sp.]